MQPHNRKMTVRARWYLIIAAARHLLIAGFVIILPGTLSDAPSFAPMVEAAPPWLWGIMFAGAGIACGAGAYTTRARIARLGLMLSASSTGMVTVGLAVAAVTGDLKSSVWPIMFGAVAAKDFTVCADPLRSPFEEWVEEIEADDLEREERAAE